MSVHCAHCDHNNPDESGSCQACGRPLRQEPELTDSLSQTGPFVPQAPPPPPTPTREQTTGSLSQTGESSLPFVPQAPPSPTTSTREQATGNRSQFHEGTLAFMPQTPQAPQSPFMPVMAQQPSLPIVQMGTISTNVSLSNVHAFAGKGVLLTHQSWFIGEKAIAAQDMARTSLDILGRRGIFGLKIATKNLQDHGTQTEIRHYLVLQREVATIFLYIAPAGRDLYISRATTVLTSIDPFRVFLLIASLFIGILFFLLFPISIPIWLGLIVFFSLSFRNWLRERDFWIYLRKRDLNDFQIDDVAVLEQLTDDTLKVAAKLNEIDADKLVPPAKGYQHERRVRAV